MAPRGTPETPPRGGLRVLTARGGAINAAFLSGAELLVLAQGLLATALLGPDLIGLYGVVTTTAMTIVALRRVGIDEAFVQTAADDEEAEFQRALTVELALGLLGALAVAALAPVLAAAYDDSRLLGLTLAVTYLPVAFALQAPQWVFFKRMEYVRLRTLQAIVPLVTVAVAVPLLLAGVEVWALVIGPFCGNVVAIAAAWRASPYRLRLRAGPRGGAALPALLVAGVRDRVRRAAGGAGADRGLRALRRAWRRRAGSRSRRRLTRYADRADQILATTIYPAIVRVRDRVDVLVELFEKANRLTLMWAFPFGAGLALFGADLIVFVLGDEWRGAIVLLGGMAVAVALQQVGYSWFAFYRARGESWPQAVESAVFGAAFAGVRGAGGAARRGVGFVAGRVGCTVCVLLVRRVYVRRLLPGARLFEPGAAGGGAGRAGLGAGVGAAAGAVGRGADVVAGAARAGAVAGRAGGRDAPARGRAAVRAARIPARGRRAGVSRFAVVTERRCTTSSDRRARVRGHEARAALAGGRGRLRVHAAPLSRAARRGHPDAGRDADGVRAVAVARLRLVLRPGPAAGRDGARQALRPVAAVVAAAAGGRGRDLRGAGVRARAAAGGARWALAAWAAAAVTVAQPTSANPTGPALAFSLAAVLFATRARPGWAGAMAALAAFWRPDVGAIAALAAAATLLLARDEEAPEEVAEGGGAGNGHVPLPDGARQRGRGGRGRARRGGGRGAGAARRGGGAGRARWAAARGGARGAARRAAARRARRGEGGAPGAARRGGDGRGRRRRAARWGRGRFVARDERGVAARRVRVAICLLAATGGLLVLYAPFLLAAGPTTVWEALVVQATRDGEWWRLPFPDGFGGGDAKDFLTWLAPYGALLVLALAALRFRRTAGLVVLGLGAAIYYVSRADLEHAQGLLVIAAAAAALRAAAARGRRVARAAARSSASANRASALLRPPDLAPYRGVRVPPREAAGAATDGRGRAAARPARGADLRRAAALGPRDFSNPLIHYLTDRPNVLRRDVLLQAKPEEQERIVAALATRAAEGDRALDRPESAKPEPNRRGRPSGSRALDEYLASAYVARGPLRRLRGAQAALITTAAPTRRPSTRRSGRRRRAGCRCRAGASRPRRCGRRRSSGRRRTPR